LRFVDSFLSFGVYGPWRGTVAAAHSQPPRSSSMKKIARSAQSRSVPGDQHWQMTGEARRVGFHSLSMRFTAPLDSGVPSRLPRALAAASAALVRSEELRAHQQCPRQRRPIAAARSPLGCEVTAPAARRSAHRSRMNDRPANAAKLSVRSSPKCRYRSIRQGLTNHTSHQRRA